MTKLGLSELLQAQDWLPLDRFLERADKLAATVLRDLEPREGYGSAEPPLRVVKAKRLRTDVANARSRKSVESRVALSVGISLALTFAALKRELADDAPPPNKKVLTRSAYLKAKTTNPDATQSRLAQILGLSDDRALRRWVAKNIK